MEEKSFFSQSPEAYLNHCSAETDSVGSCSMKAQPRWSVPKKNHSIHLLPLQGARQQNIVSAHSSVLLLLDTECCRLSLTVTSGNHERLCDILHIAR